jgi:hypothetical protein
MITTAWRSTRTFKSNRGLFKISSLESYQSEDKATGGYKWQRTLISSRHTLNQLTNKPTASPNSAQAEDENEKFLVCDILALMESSGH